MARKVPIFRRGGIVVAIATVDPVDYELVMQHRWHLDGSGYAVSSKWFRMHRLICGLTTGDGLQVDHRNHIRLDNRRANLIVVQGAREQMQNASVHKGASSRFRGVSWVAKRKKWQASVTWNYRSYWLGRFDTEEEAAKAAAAFRAAHMPFSLDATGQQ